MATFGSWRPAGYLRYGIVNLLQIEDLSISFRMWDVHLGGVIFEQKYFLLKD
jgi:hypothetical protein